MKIYNKILTSFLVSALGLAAVSCNDNDITYDVADMPENLVYFPSGGNTYFTLKSGETSVSIPVYRTSKSGSLSVNVAVKALDEYEGDSPYTFSTTVDFADGQNIGYISVTYDPDLVEFDDEQQFELTLLSNTINVGPSTEIVTLVYPSPWTSLGVGTYIDEFDWVNENGAVTTVEFFQNDLDPSLFRVTNPYEWDLETDRPEYFQFRLLQPGETYLDQVIPDDLGETIVAYSDFPIEYYADYETDLYLVFPGRFGADSFPVETWVYNYVVDWQDNGLPGEIHLSPYYYMFGVGGWNETANEEITILFPGYNKADLSVAVTYNGMLHKADESMEVVAYVELGADVTDAKVAVVPGGSISQDILDGIEDGSIESQVISETSQVNLAFDVANPTGKYSIVAISYYDGEARDYDYATFSYTAGTPETWTLVSEGLYTYLEFWQENLGLEPEVLELYESDSTPGKFKITHWMNDQDFLFTVDEDGTIYVEEEQNTGVSAGGDEVWVDDGTLWGLDPGYLEDGVYNFSVVYYNSVSFDYYDYGVETFEPSTAGVAVSYKTRATSVSFQKGKSVKLNKKAKASPTMRKKPLSFHLIKE